MVGSRVSYFRNTQEICLASAQATMEFQAKSDQSQAIFAEFTFEFLFWCLQF